MPRQKILSIGSSNENNRQKWLEQTLKKIPSGLNILDAGAGECQFKRFCSHLNYVAQDFAQYNGQGNRKGLHTKTWDNSKLDIISDITTIPRPDQSFDAIMCTEVFEHIPDPISAIKEFSRLTKKGGYLIITAPFCSLTHFAPYHFYSGFNEFFYRKHLAENGFEILELNKNGNYYEYVAQEIRRLPGMIFDSLKIKSSMIKLLGKLIVYPILAGPILILGLLNRKEDTSDLCCFGFHVLAKKI